MRKLGAVLCAALLAAGCAGETLQLKVGESRRFAVAADRSLNRSGIAVRNGEVYAVALERCDGWADWGHAATPERGVAEPTWLMSLFTPLRRVRGENWLVLVGGVRGEAPRPLLDSRVYAPQNAEEAELVAFANDARGFYWNNSGEALLRVTRVE